MKKADVKLAHIKKDKTVIDNNNRPVNILPNLFKVYESCMYDQICAYFEPILSIDVASGKAKVGNLFTCYDSNVVKKYR